MTLADLSSGDIPRNAPLLRLFFDSLLNVNTSRTPDQDPTLKVPRQSEAEHPHRRPLMLRQEILQMPADEQLKNYPARHEAYQGEKDQVVRRA
jgi:hypothetical protein